MGCSVKTVFLLMVAALAAVGGGVEGQTPMPSCGAKLTGCAGSLNSTDTPPSTCCEPLKDAVKNDIDCLCTLFNTPGLLTSLGIDINKALLLPSRCKISGGLNSCVKASGPSSSDPVPPPPATPGNGVGKIAASSWGGVSGLVILFWAASMTL